MRVLEASALPVWSMDGVGGMPSLQETLRGHVRAGFSVTLVLPEYHLFAPALTRLAPGTGDLDVHIAPMPWFPVVHAIRSAVRRATGRAELPYLVRWGLDVCTCLLLTASLMLAIMRLRRRGARFDLVYTHNQYAAAAGWFSGLLYGVPNVTRLYGTFLADLMRLPLVTLRYPTAAAGFRVPSDLLICANDGTRGDEVARKMGIAPERFRFWQNGVDLPDVPARESRREVAERLNAPGLRLEAKWAVSCSRLSYWKRIDRLLEALRVARVEGCDVQLVVAGDGAERANLERLAQRLGVGKETVWLGAVAHDDVWALLHVADIFVIANDVTNRCNPVYEAIASGLPLVSIEDASTADLLVHEENALLVKRDDTDELGRCVARLCRDDQLRERLRQAQRARCEKLWSWEERMSVEVRELMALIERGGRSGRRRLCRRRGSRVPRCR